MDDLISRQAAIDVLAAMQGLCTSKAALIQNSKIWQQIKDLPSAQPERKMGRWISRDGEEDCYECSECHAVIEGDEVYWRNNYFCYHCGADMRGGQDG